MSSRIWCFTPNPVLEIKFLGGRTVVSAGGKGHNVAQQLRQWGAAAVSVVPITGMEWRHAAGRDRIPIREIPFPSEARRGWAFVEGAGKRLDFFTENPRWKSADWGRCRKNLGRWIRPRDWLVVAGSVPKGARRGWWKSLFLRLKKRNVRILVDGKGQILREALQAGVDWAKCNLPEAEETVNRKGASACLASMRRLCGGRCSLVVTLGAQGLVLQAGKTHLSVPAPKIRLCDATGSGDVVAAAVVFGLTKNWSAKKIVMFAARMGAANASRHDVGMVPAKVGDPAYVRGSSPK